MISKPNTYVGLNNDINGGMTTIGRIIRDARVFCIIAETETCEGWNFAGIDSLLDKVNKEWDKYGCLVNHLPPDLFERHQQIHGDAIAQAKAEGWSGEQETDDES